MTEERFYDDAPDAARQPRPDEDAPGEAPAQADSTTDQDVSLEQLQREVSDLTDRHLRLAAEFDNYRRRTERERSSLEARAQATLLRRLLDVIDDLERVTDHAEASTSDSLLEGVQLVEKKLHQVLGGFGLRSLDAAGKPFDPETMEALATVPAESAEEDDVVSDVFQKGYALGDTLVRPARVRVRKYEG